MPQDNKVLNIQYCGWVEPHSKLELYRLRKYCENMMVSKTNTRMKMSAGV